MSSEIEDPKPVPAAAEPTLDEAVDQLSSGIEHSIPVPGAAEQTLDEEEILSSLTDNKPRQWLMDRSNGCSKVDAERLGRPFCRLCWPPPCVQVAPDCFEQNSFCEGFGNIGAFPEDHETSRIWLMRKSLLIHFVGFIMSALACLAITSDPEWLQKFSFSSGVITGTIGETDIEEVKFEIGLTTVYTSDFYFGERTHELNELCTGTVLGIPLTSQDDCEMCSEASSGLVVTLIMGVVVYLPTIASNVNRAYYNYDVNCQKVFGTLVALISMVVSLYTWQGYAQQCVESFFDGDVTIPVLVPREAGNGIHEFNPENYPYIDQFDPSALQNRTVEDIQQNGISIEEVFPNVDAALLAGADVQIAQVNFDWTPGVGLILVIVATFLKVFDIINHFLIRTPSITRDLPEQLEYERKYGAMKAEERDTTTRNEDLEA